MNNDPIDIRKELKTASWGAGISASGIILQNILYFFCTLFLARILGAESYGLYSLALSIAGIGAVISGLGLQAVPSRFIPIYIKQDKKNALNSFIAFVLRIQSATGILVALVLAGFSTAISVKLYNKPSLVPFLIAFSLLIPFQKLNDLFKGLFRGFKRINYSVYIHSIFEPSFRLVCLAVIMFVGLKAPAVFVVLFAGSILALAINWKVFHNNIMNDFLPSDSQAANFTRKEILLFGLPIFLATCVTYLIQRTDILMIGYFLSADNVGIYNVAYKIALIVWLPLVSLNNIFPPIISELHAERDYPKLAETYKIFTRIVLKISFFTFFCILLLAGPMLSMIGKPFLGGLSVLVLLGGAQIINVSVGSAGYLLSMTGRPRISLYNSLTLLALNIFLNLLLIPRYGMMGAAIATSISILLINVLRLVEVRAILKIHPFSLSYFKPVLSGVIFLGIRHLLMGIGVTNILVMLSLYITLFLAVELVSGINKEDKYILSLMKNRLRGQSRKEL